MASRRLGIDTLGGPRGVHASSIGVEGLTDGDQILQPLTMGFLRFEGAKGLVGIRAGMVDMKEKR